MNKQNIYNWKDLADRQPAYALVNQIDLVVVRIDEQVVVYYGRCLHRGALMADGYVEGDNLICGVHKWDYRLNTGVSQYNNAEVLHKFSAGREDGQVWVDADEVAIFAKDYPHMLKREEYLGNFIASAPAPEEDSMGDIHTLAKNGLMSHHGPMAAMGVGRNELPAWDSIQILPAQLMRRPLLDDNPVGTQVMIGPNAQKPLRLEIPLFVSDMSFGSLSEESKIALSRGAEMAGTGICSGEGGMLPEEQAENKRYFYELASAQFGFKMELMARVQAFHFKGGQGAKTGTGGHLPGHKNKGRISEVRGIPAGEPAISPATFLDMPSLENFKSLAEEVRSASGGIPIGFKLSANHIEADIDAALAIGVDYIILDGRGGGTGAAPLIFRNHISVPTIAALARARQHLNKLGRSDVTLIITGGLRTAPDFIKALALGADAIALSNSALQAIGCQAMRACHTNYCPVGIATQKESLRARLDIQKSAVRLNNFFEASVKLMQVMARACGHNHLNKFRLDDLGTLDREIAHMSGVAYTGLKL